MAVRPQTDDIAFEELWEHRERVRAACHGLADDAMDVEDLVQETYLRALTTSHPPDRRGSASAWLATVARHRAIDRIRSERRLRVAPHELVASDAVVSDPAEQLVSAERSERVRRALTELGSQERGLLVQQVVHGKSISELAEEFRISEASVRSLLWRARRKFRAVVERGGPLGTTPLPRLSVRWQRARQAWNRIEELGVPVVVGAGMFATEALAAAASALLLGAASLTGVAGIGAHTASAVGVSASVATAAVPIPDARLRSDLMVHGVRQQAGADLGTTVPSARLTVDTRASDVGGEVMVELDPTHAVVTVTLLLPPPFDGPSEVDWTCRVDVECDALAVAAEEAEPLTSQEQAE